MLKAGRPVVAPGIAEGMEVFFAVELPVLELDAQLEGRLRLAHEFGLADAEQAVEHDQRRDRRLAHADGADGIAFHQRQVDRIAHGVGKRSGGHPAGRAATGNHDAAGFVIASHRLKVLKRKVRMRLALSAVSGERMPRAFSGMWSVTSGGLSNT